MLTLVTGATGLVGNNVVRMLLERGQAVRVLQRASSDPRPLKGLDVEFAQGDIRDAEAVGRAAEGVDRIVHAAAHVHIGWRGADLHRAINVEGTRNVVAAARQADARLVHVSSVDALGMGTRHTRADENSPPDPHMRIPYAKTKREAEQVILAGVAEGLRAVIVNPVFMLGPWDWKPSSGRMLLTVASGTMMFSPRGGNDFCDVRDVASGILAAFERGEVGRRYILGGEGMSYLEAWRMMARVTGTRRPLCKAGPLAIRAAGLFGDIHGRLTGKESEINSAAARMSALHHHFSYTRAAEELGYAPRPAQEAAGAAWEWFIEHGYAKRRKGTAPRGAIA